MKTDTSAVFRKRLDLVVTRSGDSLSGFARSAGVDRSTLAQLLNGEDPRLPRAETLMAVAKRARVSVDWLLGLSQQEEISAEVISAMLRIEEHGNVPAGDHFANWLKEAEGFRIRTVPVALPDFLKNEALLRFEYKSAFEHASPVQFEAVRARLDFMCNPDSDVEVCVALQSLQSLARGEERWAGFPATQRVEQIEYMARIYGAAYPGLRLYLYDVREVYSAPFTVFGLKRAVVFLGTNYLVLNGSDHIRMFSRRFDDLIRLAIIQPHEVARVMRSLFDLVD